MVSTRSAVAGHNTVIAFDEEDSFSGGVPGTPDWSNFGVDTSVTTKDGSHNVTKLFDPDSRGATQFEEEVFEGSISVEFVLENPKFLSAVIAEGDGASPETFSGDFPVSFVIIIGDEVRDDEDIHRGCVCTDFEVSCDVPGEARVTLDFVYADVETDTGGIGNTSGLTGGQPTPSNPPLTFVDATYEVGTTAVSIVQDASLSVSNNPDMLPGFGSNTYQDYSPKERAVDSSYSKVKQSTTAVDEKDKLYGGGIGVASNTPTEDGLTYTFGNGTEEIKFETGPGILDTLAEEGLADVDSDVLMSPDRPVRRDRPDTPIIKATATGY